MFNRSTSRFAAVAVAASLVTVGCATTNGEAQEQAGGAVVGALLGCGIGALTTGNAKGCAAGAAAGAVAGWAAVKISQYEDKQVRSAKADARMYGLTKPVSSPQVKIRNKSVSPAIVRAGEKIKVKTDYSLMLPASQSVASVDGSFKLKKDGKLLQQFPAKTKQLEAGGRDSSATISLPADAEPGTYVIEHQIKSGSSYDTDESTFVVKS